MECPICGKAFERKVHNRSNGWKCLMRPTKTCSRRCGAVLRAGDREAVFWSRVDQSGGPDACWPWTRSRHHTGGYGHASWKGRLTAAHRVAYELANGSIDNTLDVLHRCDNPPCCNARHLFQGTHDDNMKDMARKNRSGDHRGRNNGRALVTEDDVRAIRRSHAAGVPQVAIAEYYGIAQPTVSQIVRRVRWRHIPD